MGWINDYWYLIVLGLVAVYFRFGYRSKSSGEGTAQDKQNRKVVLSHIKWVN